MNYVHALIDRAKQFTPKKTEYGLCQALGMRQTDLIKIKNGRGFFGQRYRVRISEITKIPLEDVTAMLEFERSKSDDEKEFWRQRLPRISAAILVGIVGFAATHGHADALLAFCLPVMPANTLYIMRSDFDVGTLIALCCFLFFCASQSLDWCLPTTKACDERRNGAYPALLQKV